MPPAAGRNKLRQDWVNEHCFITQVRMQVSPVLLHNKKRRMPEVPLLSAPSEPYRIPAALGFLETQSKAHGHKAVLIRHFSSQEVSSALGYGLDFQNQHTHLTGVSKWRFVMFQCRSFSSSVYVCVSVFFPQAIYLSLELCLGQVESPCHSSCCLYCHISVRQRTAITLIWPMQK